MMINLKEELQKFRNRIIIEERSVKMTMNVRRGGHHAGQVIAIGNVVY